MLNQGLLPSQASSGTIMSAPGQGEEGKQTKGGEGGEGGKGGEGKPQRD